MRSHYYLSAIFLVLSMLVTGCATTQAPEALTTTNNVSTKISNKAPLGQAYQVNSAQSELRILVYPDGRLGHNHVIGGPVIRGQIVVPKDYQKTWLSLSIPVDAMQLDKPAWRLAEGFSADLSAQAIAGTRKHMLSDKVLDAKRYPNIEIRADELSGPLWQPDVRAQITIAGVTREITIPVSVKKTANELDVTGHFAIKQTDFGITPFSALGGILKIADTLTVRFRVVAYAQGAQ